MKAGMRRAPTAVNLIEEAVHLLRGAGLRPLLCYYTGGLPFILGLLFFFSDMSQGAFADQRTGRAALWMVFLYVWLKCWQAAFAASLRSRLLGHAHSEWTLSRVWRLIVTQLALQPSGLVFRFLSIQLLLPYPWVRAYYENITALGGGESPAPEETARRARAQAKLWAWQNFQALNVLFSFGLIVWVNIAIMLGFLPAMLKTLTGIETIFSQSGLSMLNTTFVLSSIAIAYLCVDPIFKAFYVVRCFYGESLRSGEDLRVRLRQYSNARLAALVTAWLVVAATPSFASGERIQPEKLDRKIEQVLERREFAWRMPPPPANQEEEDRGLIARFLSSFADAIVTPIKSLFRAIRDMDEWLRQLLKDWFPTPDAGESNDSRAWIESLPAILYTLIGVALLLILAIVIRNRRCKRRSAALAAAVAAPDLSSEDLTADQLPEDGWMQLSREMTTKGELRLALRALYLAGLSHLGSRSLITIARYKSNRDYARELHRRARFEASLLEAFDRSMAGFERSWYGNHAVTQESLSDFAAIMERIRTC